MKLNSKKTVLSQKSLLRDPRIVSLILAVAITWLGFGLVSPLRTLYARAEGVSGGEVGLMGAAYLFSAFVFLFPFGWLSDRYNRVNLIVGGLVAHALITVAFLFTRNGDMFIALRFLEGVSSAAVTPAARALLADLVPKGRNGEAFGLMSSGLVFGMLAGPPVGTFLAEFFGYNPAYWLATFMFLPAIVLMLLVFRRYHTAPQPLPPQTDAQTGATTSTRLWTVPVIIGCLVRCAISFGPSLGITIWSVYMADLGFQLSAIGWTYTVYAVPILLVAPSAGRFSDRYGRLGMMFVGGLIVGLIWMIYGLAPSFVAIMGLGIVEGSFDAICRSANDGYLADHTPLQGRGRAQSVFNAAQQLGSLVSAIFAGFLYEVNHGLPFFVMGGVQIILLGIALSLFLILRLQRPTVLTVQPAES